MAEISGLILKKVFMPNEFRMVEAEKDDRTESD
jgi:hypothetical protein